MGGEFVLLNSSRRTSLDIQIRKSSFAVLALVALTSNLCSVGTGSKRLWSYPHLLRLEHVLRRSLCLFIGPIWPRERIDVHPAPAFKMLPEPGGVHKFFQTN